MMISDAATRFLGGRVLQRESPEEFVLALERGWIRTFGPMKILQVDDHRSWSSDYVKSWCSENGIQLQISPGQSHTRLAILERRHQVTRRAIELYIADQEQGDVLQPYEPRERLIQALCYVIPQINRGTNVRGYSPVQWVLGYTPHVPGLLTEEPLELPSLDPSDEFLQKLQRQKKAANAVFSADVDVRLRRALNRKFTGQLTVFQLGDLCYYYRDGPGGIGPKLRWRGPARVVMVEQLESGPHTTIYWVVHGTNLLRTAPEHLRPVPEQDVPKTADDDPFYRAQQALQGVRSRGTTLYTDLTRTNKRQRHEVSSDEEDEEFDDEELPAGDDEHPGLRDTWEISDDRKTWTRIHNVPRRELYVPENDSEVPVDRFSSDRLTTVRRLPPHPPRVRLRDDWRVIDASRSLHYTWTGTTTFVIEDKMDDDSDVLVELFGDTDAPPEPEEPPNEPPPTNGDGQPQGRNDEQGGATPNGEDGAGGQNPQQPPQDSPPIVESDPAPVPEHQRRLYEAPPAESFQTQRARVDKQETLSFLHRPTEYGPIRSESSRTTPYDHPTEEDLNMQIDIDIEKITDLPPGWHVENGWLCLDAPTDEWTLEGNWLIRNHYVPRKGAFKPTEDTCPVDLNYLAKDRVTATSHGTFKDRWKRHSVNHLIEEAYWTGQTKFKLKPNWRTKAQEDYKKASGGYKSMRTSGDQPLAKKKKGRDEVYERYMSVSDRQAFMKAKIKELDSFFKNEVWLYDHENNADPSRALKAHFILTWKKNEDGTPRAKARLITQGFKDPDALSGALTTNAPTLTRLARGMILSICQLYSWKMFTSDITTAFLQGKNFAEGSDRVIWIKLPKDAKMLLCLDAEAPQLMKLVKPMYGLCDAPRAWYEEASERILKVGDGNILRHPLDPCLFMVYKPWPEGTPLDPNVERDLAGIFGIHVDDLVGCGNPDDPIFTETKKKLQEVFTFREWQDGDKLEYCGSQIDCQRAEVITLGQEEYIHKVKPIPVTKERLQMPDTPVTEKERSLLRGLIGGLQWPATQSSPHLQVGISRLTGETSRATVATLQNGNKHLRYAKEYADVGLQYRRLGEKNEMTFVVYSDASFATRQDLSSQGGYLLAMCHKDVADGKCEAHYNVLDWRSWKLPRVARSTLSAESQAASEAADSLMYTSLFWNMIFRALLPLDSVETGRLANSPKLIVDAKALYDILVKEEIQAATGADKRTTIEALVCRDKLACCNGKVMWVSSELQYADGLTKDAAAPLLGQRLRSHMTKLKSDETFQASKKKNISSRKKGENMYAIKRPERALYAMFANYFLDVVNAHETEKGGDGTMREHYIPEGYDMFDFMILIFFTMLLGIMVWLGMRCFGTTSISWTTKSSPPKSTRECYVQTDRTGLEEQRLVELRKDKMKLLEEVAHFRNEWALAEGNYQENRHQVQVLQRMNQKILEECENTLQQKMKVAKQSASLKPIYLAAMGGCWHASRGCVAGRTANVVYERQPCKACSHMFFEECTPKATPGATHWTQNTYGDLTGTSAASDSPW